MALKNRQKAVKKLQVNGFLTDNRLRLGEAKAKVADREMQKGACRRKQQCGSGHKAWRAECHRLRADSWAAQEQKRSLNRSN